MVDRIKTLLKTNNIPVSLFCENIGIAKNAMSEWKSGRIKPSVDTVIKIANYFDVSMDWLLTGSDARANLIKDIEREQAVAGWSDEDLEKYFYLESGTVAGWKNGAKKSGVTRIMEDYAMHVVLASMQCSRFIDLLPGNVSRETLDKLVKDVEKTEKFLKLVIEYMKNMKTVESADQFIYEYMLSNGTDQSASEEDEYRQTTDNDADLLAKLRTLPESKRKAIEALLE